MSTTAWSAPQPLDKISLQICQLLAFPCYLQFIAPFVNNFQAIDFNETETIKFYDIDFRELLHFLVQCGAILDTVRVQEPSRRPKTHCNHRLYRAIVLIQSCSEKL